MYAAVRREIPEFLSEQVVYCDNFTHKQGFRTCFLLTKQLKFYEFHRKVLLCSTDLSGTVLKIVADRIREYNGPKGKWFDVDNTPVGTQELSGEPQRSDPAKSAAGISIGKFIYLNLDVRKLYLLLQCWDKLVVVYRSNETRQLEVVAQYEQVTHCKIVNGAAKLQAVTEIAFQSGRVVHTGFQTNELHSADSALQATQTGDFKQLLERIKCAKTEWQVHKKLTQNKLGYLRDVQAFGTNSQRTLKLEEKQKLSRFGDIWIRLPPDSSVVIGVPLVNNCAPPNLTVLRNLKPIFIPHADHSHKGISVYRYRLYQLRQSFEGLDTVETFFQSEDEELQAGTWHVSPSCSGPSLLPESYGVLVIQLKVSQVIAIGECQLLLCYESEEKSCKSPFNEQQLFVRNLNFNKILCGREMYELSFGIGTLHQDFLSIAITSVEMKLLIRFVSAQALNSFEHLLAQKFAFKTIVSSRNSKPDQQIPEHFDMDDELEPTQHTGARSVRQTLFYNDNPASLWYGMLALKQPNDRDDSDSLRTTWKFYSKNKEYSYLVVKQLFQDLIITKSNVHQVEYSLFGKEGKGGSAVEIIRLENALRLEVKSLLELNTTKASESDIRKHYRELKMLELNTDHLVAAINV